MITNEFYLLQHKTATTIRYAGQPPPPPQQEEQRQPALH